MRIRAATGPTASSRVDSSSKGCGPQPPWRLDSRPRLPCPQDYPFERMIAGLENSRMPSGLLDHGESQFVEYHLEAGLVGQPPGNMVFFGVAAADIEHRGRFLGAVGEHLREHQLPAAQWRQRGERLQRVKGVHEHVADENKIESGGHTRVFGREVVNRRVATLDLGAESLPAEFERSLKQASIQLALGIAAPPGFEIEPVGKNHTLDFSQGAFHALAGKPIEIAKRRQFGGNNARAAAFEFKGEESGGGTDVEH